ncbi:hypothetical protein [Neobacillus sp. FSL H8-0543]|uniref:hypothetical protein n=1 Tax=Neobacillus sp. FSL H8-0543 TaxID=2954672 RepID=UPI0031580A6C
MLQDEVKKIVISQLLEMLKIAFHTANLFPTGGADFKTISSLENEIFNAIKIFCGMPKEERGVFAADKYLAFAFDYATGNLSRDEAVHKIFNWESDSMDEVGEGGEQKKAASARTPAADK